MPSYFPEGDAPLATDSPERSMAKVVSLLPEFLDQSGANPDPDPEPQPNVNGGPTTFNAVIISGSDAPFINGTYVEDGTVNGKNKYSKDSDGYIFWDGNKWLIYSENDFDIIYEGTNVEFPWQVETWADPYAYEQPILTPTSV
jgi:hypothetical protein